MHAYYINMYRYKQGLAAWQRKVCTFRWMMQGVKHVCLRLSLPQARAFSLSLSYALFLSLNLREVYMNINENCLCINGYCLFSQRILEAHRMLVCVCVCCVCVCVCVYCVCTCVCVCVCVCVQFKWAWHEAQRMIQKDEKILDEHHARCTFCVASARERENLCG